MTTNSENKWNPGQIPKENPFKTPENYFDNFSVRMTDKISAAETGKNRKTVLAWGQPQVTMLVAFAGVAIMVIIGINFLRDNDKPLSSAELAEAIEFSIVSEMDENDIINQIDAANHQSSLSNDSIAKINDGSSKQLIDYLSKEDLDVDAIVDEL